MNNSVDILPFLSIVEQVFFLFIAPPGWGKTTMILDLYERFDQKIVFISPLRALGDEFYMRASSMGSVYDGKCESQIKQFMKKKKGLLVLTAERLSEEIIEVETSKDTLFIFDEFHLFYYWGESFRPLLKERMMKVVNEGGSILGLTATMSEELMKMAKKEFQLNIDHFYILDLGNQYLINFPKVVRNYSFVNEKVFNRRFVRSALSCSEKGVLILFVRYRSEVDRWVNFLNRNKVRTLGCVGGEVSKFIDDLKKINNLKCIISTTTLSHGVNLPTISEVYISYPVQNKDFWIQMVGRGGRDGSKFELHHKEVVPLKSKKLLWNTFQSVILLIEDFIYQLVRGRV